jgi:hypothetical protein
VLFYMYRQAALFNRQDSGRSLRAFFLPLSRTSYLPVAKQTVTKERWNVV